jgi:hypothetical protein
MPLSGPTKSQFLRRKAIVLHLKMIILKKYLDGKYSVPRKKWSKQDTQALDI